MQSSWQEGWFHPGPEAVQAVAEQLMEIVGERTMIQDAVGRLKGFVTSERIFVVTNKVQKNAVIGAIARIPVENIITEPIGREHGSAYRTGRQCLCARLDPTE